MNEEKTNTVEPVKNVDDNIKNNGEGTGVGTQANENKDEGKAEKTYTQEEYNALDKKLQAKYEKKYGGIDIAKYNEWVESQKTAEQKQAEKEAEYVEKDKKITLLENRLKLKENDVSKEYEDFVLFTVGNMEGEFDDNLSSFLKENPKYIKGKETTEHKATGTPVKTVSSSENDGVLAILKAKHPELNI